MVKLDTILVVLASILFSGVVFATPSFHQYSTLDQAIQRVFPKSDYSKQQITLTATQATQIEAALFQALPSSNITVFTFKKEGELKGYGMVLNEIGKHYPITFFVGLTPDLAIKDTVVLIYREDYGNAVRKRRFLAQFRKKTVKDPVRVNHDITSVSGATLSSYAIAAGVKRALIICNAIKNTTRMQPVNVN